MTDGPGSQEILFVDDFTHSTTDLHWDHIKFDHAILIDQIRIIPANCPIQLSNGNVHLGTTNPSKFHLDFFSNNLHKLDLESSCLDKLGSLNFEENNRDTTLVLSVASIPTDWLVIAGSYKSLSIAVIGNKVQKSSPSLAQLSHIPVVQSCNYAPSTVNGRFPPLIRNHQRHHPYSKPAQQTAKAIKEESHQEIKSESPLELQDQMEEIAESSLVKYYLNLDECSDEMDIVGQQVAKVDSANLIFDPNEFRLESKLKKKSAKLDGLSFDLLFLIENLSQDMLDYLPQFKNQIHQMLKSVDIKNHNLIFKLCKGLHEKHPKFLIDQVLEVSSLVVDLILFYIKQTFSYQLFKLVNLLNMVLNSAKAVENFVHTNYPRLIKQLEQMNNMSSRLTSGVGQLLLKIQFNQNLTKLDSMCSSLDQVDFEQVKCVYESIVAYTQQHILTNDSLLFPIEPIFSNKNSLNKEIFNFFDEKNFFKNILLIWSNNDTMFNNLAEKFMADFFLPSALNGHSLGPIEYLCNNGPLFNSILSVCSHQSTLAPTLSHSVHFMALFDQFTDKFGALKHHRHGTEQFSVVDCVQQINFALNEKSRLLTHLLSQPDGNFNNKYFRSLVEFFEYLIDDSLDSNLRCYAMNSTTNILCTLCSNNTNWSIAAPKDYALVKKLYKLSSHLFNNLIMTSLKPSGERNQSYFKLIDKLKLIISVLEPFYSFKDGDKNFLNYVIDSFREQIDKNVSAYLAKYAQSPAQPLNYLNGNITQMVMLRNGLKSIRPNGKLAKKILLGNLVNKNLCHLLVNFLSRLSDYVTYYHGKCELAKSSKLAALVQSSVWLVKVIVLNLFKVQQAKFDDFYVVEILLDFLPSLSKLSEDAEVRADLMDIFAIYCKFKAKKMFDLISGHIVKRPQNQPSGLDVFDVCLSVEMAPSQLKSLFKENNRRCLMEENAAKESTCVRMIKLMCLSVELRDAFVSVCKKVAGKELVKILVDYLIELIGEIKLNFSLNEVESFRKQEVAPKEDFLYEVELPPIEQSNHQLTQINLSEYKIFLVKKFVHVAKFVIHFGEQIDKSMLVDFFNSQPVISSEWPNYADFVPGLLRYFNQIDFNVKNAPTINELCRIQEAILDLSFLFVQNVDQCQLSKILVDHLGMTQLSHAPVDIKCLRCLTHLANKQQIVAYHFSNLKYLTNFIGELAAKLKDMPLNEAVDVTNSFYGYMKVLVEAVMEHGDRQKLWTLFDWSEKNSNDSLIDSISTSSSSFNGSLLHCIINLDKSLELYHARLSDEESKKKFKSIVNQSSGFIKYLNEMDAKMLAFFGEAKLEAECADEAEPLVHLDLQMQQPSELILMQDKELYKKLRSSLEEVSFQCQPMEEFEEKVAKAKSPDMINTRTGVRYKAPMRGGHASSSTRPMSSLLTNSSSVPAISHLAPQASGLARTDSFRSRPQNTSRPPSLHVDDFYRIEQQQKQLNNSATDSSNDTQLSRNNSLNDLSYEELSVKIGEGFETKNFNAISPQVKNLKSPLVTSSQQSSTQFIGQSIKMSSMQNQYGMNQMVQYGNGDMNRFNYAGSHDMNGVFLNPGENMSQMSPGQMQQQQQQIQVMQNQMYNNSFRFAPTMQNRANNPAHSMHMMRGGMRRGVTIPNFNQLGQMNQNQNYSNGTNFGRPPYHN